MKKIALLAAILLATATSAFATQADDTATCALQVAAALPKAPGLVIKSTSSHGWKSTDAIRRHGKLDIEYSAAGQNFMQTWYCAIGAAGVVTVMRGE